MKSVLLIEDSRDERESIELLLGSDDWVVTAVPTPHDAFTELKRETFDIIICDLHLPFILDKSLFEYPYSIEVGLRTIQTLRELFPTKPVIGISASLPWDLERLSQEKNLEPFLSKPFGRQDLVGLIEKTERMLAAPAH